MENINPQVDLQNSGSFYTRGNEGFDIFIVPVELLNGSTIFEGM